MNRLKLSRFLLKLGIVIILVSSIILGFLLKELGEKSLKQAYNQEITSVQRLAGAIIGSHPEMEEEFLNAVKNDSNEIEEAGEKILDKYGYDKNKLLTNNQIYQDVQSEYNFYLITVLILLLTAIILTWILMTINKNSHNKEILSVVEQLLSEDYDYINKFTEGTYNQIGDMLQQLGNQINIKNIKLNDEKESTKSLVTDISHQLKTPIASLKTCFYMYLEADTQSEKEEFLYRSQLQLQKLEALTASLVNISRMETAMITLNPEAADLKEIIIRSVNSIYDKAKQKNIEIELEDFDDITLNMDIKWTAEAITNVLDNSIKYSPVDTNILISVEKMVSFIKIEIRDFGIGIKKEDYNKVFQRFYRGCNDIVKNSEGSGIGLYLTRSILEKQGGSIRVKSEYGKGSTFTLHLKL